MKIAVFGGTGFVGSHVVDALMAAGHEVSALVRRGSEHNLPGTGVWRRTEGDLDSDAAIDATVLDCDVVVYSVGLLREYPRRKVTFENAHYAGVVRTVAAARRCNARRYILISANGVRMPGTPYQETKLRAEEHLIASGLDATVFRPSVIFGDPRGRMEFASQLHRDMVASPLPAVNFFSGIRPGDGQILMSPAYVGDVAAAICNSIEKESTIGKTIALGGPEILSWTEMILRIAAAVDRRTRIVPMPIGLMKLMASLFDWLPFFPVTRDQLTMLAENNVADSEPLENLANRRLRAFDAAGLSYLNNQAHH